MQPSLLKARKRLVPLAWLLMLAVLAPAGAHLARGMVLCVGSDHVEIEVAGLSHHEDLPGSPTAANSRSTDFVQAAVALQGAQVSAKARKPCLDVPLPVTSATDTCHQAIQSEIPDVAPLALVQSVLSLERSDDGAGPSHSIPQSVSPLPSSEPSYSTVVLLI